MVLLLVFLIFVGYCLFTGDKVAETTDPIVTPADEPSGPPIAGGLKHLTLEWAVHCHEEKPTFWSRVSNLVTFGTPFTVARVDMKKVQAFHDEIDLTTMSKGPGNFELSQKRKNQVKELFTSFFKSHKAHEDKVGPVLRNTIHNFYYSFATSEIKPELLKNWVSLDDFWHKRMLPRYRPIGGDAYPEYKNHHPMLGYLVALRYVEEDFNRNKLWEWSEKIESGPEGEC